MEGLSRRHDLATIYVCNLRGSDRMGRGSSGRGLRTPASIVREGRAMPSLRDQLIKTGLISKGQKHQVEHEKRRERKQLKKGQADDLAQEQQRQAYEARLEAQRVADRERAAAQHAQLEAKEKLLRIRHIADYWRFSGKPAGGSMGGFLLRNNIILYLSFSSALVVQLCAED